MKNFAASVRQRLLNLSRKSDQNFQELLQYFAMCRFLDRLASTDAGSRFVLKGALLLHALNLSRARSTIDIDLLGRISSHPKTIRMTLEDVMAVQVEPDGLVFDPASIELTEITRDADYEGIRARFSGKLDGAHIPMQIDIGFGDIVYPSPSELQLPSLLGYESKGFLAYAPETSIAEKAQVILHLSIANSRMKDFYDIWLMSGSLPLDHDLLTKAIASTFKARHTTLDASSVVFTDEFFEDVASIVDLPHILNPHSPESHQPLRQPLPAQ